MTDSHSPFLEEARHRFTLPATGQPVVYFLRLRSGAFYIGASTDLAQRLKDHSAGQAGRTTALDPPVALLRVEAHSTFSFARQREAQLKRWSCAKKSALIRSDFTRLRELSQSRESME